MICMEPDTDNTVMVLSENGYGKRSPLDIDATLPDGTVEHQNVYRITNRGGKGVRTMNITQKTGAARCHRKRQRRQ